MTKAFIPKFKDPARHKAPAFIPKGKRERQEDGKATAAHWHTGPASNWRDALADADTAVSRAGVTRDAKLGMGTRERQVVAAHTGRDLNERRGVTVSRGQIMTKRPSKRKLIPNYQGAGRVDAASREQLTLNIKGDARNVR